MKLSEASAELMLTRDAEGRRVYRAGLLRRRAYVICDEADRIAVVSYARWHGLTTLAFVAANALLIGLAGGWRGAVIPAASLALLALLLMRWQERRLVAKLER